MGAKVKGFRSSVALVVTMALIFSAFLVVFPIQVWGDTTYPDFSKFLTSVTLTVKDSHGDSVQTIVLDKDSGNETLPPLEIQDGTTVALSLDFALADIDDAAASGDHVAGQSYAMQLPAALAVKSTSQKDFENGLGSWKIDSSGKVTVFFADDADDYDARVGALQASSTFAADHLGQEDNPVLRFQIGAATVDLPVVVTAPEIPPSIVKTGVYSGSDNTITWTVTVKSGNDGYNSGLSDVTVTDTLSANQAFQADPEPVWGGTAVKDSGPAPYYEASGQTITFYLGGLDHDQKKTLVYTTKAADVGAKPVFPATALAYENTAVLSAEEISDPPATTATVDGNTIPSWITKSAGTPVDDATTGRAQSIPWKLTVNPYGGTIGAGAVVTDVLPHYLTVTDGSVKLGENVLGTDSAAEVYYSVSTDGEGVQTLEVHFNEELTAAQDLTFTTDVDGAYYTANHGAFANTATLTLDGDSAPSNTVSGVGTGSSVIAKTGAGYSASAHLATWNITVDANRIAMADPVVTDTIGDHQTFHAISAKQGGTPISLAQVEDSSVPDANTYFVSADGKSVTVHLSDFDAGDSPVILALITEVTDSDYYAANSTRQVSNSASLTSDTTGTINASASQNIASEVVKKWAAGYDYASKTITWDIRVDHNGMPMTNATVTDTLPAGLTLAGVKIQNGAEIPADPGSPFYYTLSGQTLSIHLNNIGAETVIEVKTKIPDSVLAEHNGSFTLDNQATLTTDTYTRTSGTASQTVDHSIVEKSGSYDPDNSILNWAVRINKNEIAPENLGIEPGTTVSLSDTFQDGLDFNPDSVRLYALSGSSGSWSKGAEIALVPADAIRYDPRTKTFTFTFPTGTDFSKAYELDFSTDVVKGGTYSNTISMNGAAINPEGQADGFIVSDQQVSAAFSGQKRGQVILTKQDKNTGEPIPDTTFTLYQNGVPIKTAVTDAAGGAVFSNLKQNVPYTVKETAPADGYRNDSAPWTFTLDADHLTQSQVFTDLPVGASGSSAPAGSNPGGHGGGTTSDPSAPESAESLLPSGADSSPSPSSENGGESASGSPSGSSQGGSSSEYPNAGGGNPGNPKTGDSREELPLLFAGMLTAAVLFVLNILSARRQRKP